ncbi:hypothetical protein PsorP6_002123 [Peronosclerospora sorghi]|uniref:Uncharacterized protein n=1 Tax=Peronosclerospora sorghi TaxID=230839 RepID=A0ACC0WTP3_9STRA|nr:hypothetical protein PsorP6_002123 [Peronosclerospora sorghi]
MYCRGGWSRQRGWTLHKRSRRHCSKEQLELWLASEETVDEVIILLKLKDEGHKMFESPKMETLNMFMEKFNAKGKKPDEKLVTMFGVLLHAFGESNLAFLLLEAVESSS